MGLDTTHGAFHGAYSAFNRFRQSVCAASGGSFPPHRKDFRLEDGSMPDAWSTYWDTDTVPEELLDGAELFFMHSDCDGTFTPNECEKVAAFLRWAVPRLAGEDWGHLSNGGPSGAAERFASGCELAAKSGEELRFE